MLVRFKRVVIPFLGVVILAGFTYQLANAAPPTSSSIQPQIITSETTSTPSGAIIFLDTSPYITVSQCTICHGSNLDNFKNPGLIFKHDPHLSRGVRCNVCHTEFPHKFGSTKKPPMDTCYNCHGLKHSNQGVVASGQCTLCHPPGFKKLPLDHTPAFKTKDHRVPAINNPFGCVACHGQVFCVTCHNNKKVKPKDHGKKPAETVKWKKTHGQKTAKGNCEVCHNNIFCTKCHVTPMPHPIQWLGNHKVEGKNTANDCKVCHADRRECSDCHHQFEKTTLLIQKNCEKCHETYKGVLSQMIAMPKDTRNKAIIIHKAHFEMTKTDPFECTECHDREYVQAKGCFSFELCYTCHGRMRGGSLIAKWGGQELCYRCHQRK